ncbi:MAG: hypothetical protein O2867_07200, partial [Bacteroidetes bacterium]|nr:hypothetical protein [Bacteroidota bacterium]
HCTLKAISGCLWSRRGQNETSFGFNFNFIPCLKLLYPTFEVIMKRGAVKTTAEIIPIEPVQIMLKRETRPHCGPLI